MGTGIGAPLPPAMIVELEGLCELCELCGLAARLAAATAGAMLGVGRSGRWCCVVDAATPTIVRLRGGATAGAPATGAPTAGAPTAGVPPTIV
ncbi:MAG TPA: hypothetical protein VNO30_30060 [Kofleriaceae bacterium]|nr:hypothetical protein [Kofleriaceae bacterium]